jgi:hypothetical protein
MPVHQPSEGKLSSPRRRASFLLQVQLEGLDPALPILRIRKVFASIHVTIRRSDTRLPRGKKNLYQCNPYEVLPPSAGVVRHSGSS